VVLEMARLGVDLRGVASFHGMLATKNPAQPGKVKAAILVCHGAADSFTPQEAVDAFKKEMTDAKVDFTVLVYEGAKHSFTNPDADKYAKEFNMPIGYNAAADKKSWSDLQQFLKKIFAR
jgi:dienelactone hydrolase